MVVSPRSYFVFTPLLASTAVGTLEFRTTLESVRARRSGVEFIQGWGNDVNFSEKSLQIEEATLGGPRASAAGDAGSDLSQGSGAKSKGALFDLKYDKLVVAVGCYSQTFGTPGVRENALFLKDVTDAILIRKRVLECGLGIHICIKMLTNQASKLLHYPLPQKLYETSFSISLLLEEGVRVFFYNQDHS